jgi:glycosyltransferase involved in cell wall biosynthesis
MKILMVIPTYSPIVGGAERQLEGLAPKLLALGHEVTIVTRRLAGTARREWVEGVEINRISCCGSSLLFAIRLIDVFATRFWSVDVVHCHTLSAPALVVSVAAIIRRIPSVFKVTRSGAGSQARLWQATKFRRALFALFSKLATSFVAVTRDARLELLAAGVADHKIATIPNGVTPSDARNIVSADCTIIYVGRLIPRKRIDLLIRAFCESRRSCSSTLVIVGDGPMRGSLQNLAEELKVADQVKFTGELARDSVLLYLRQANVFVLPSESEGMSNSLLEAMAVGVTVVAADIPANRELIDDNVNGILFAGDALASALKKVLHSPQLRRTLERNALLSVYEWFAFEKIAARYSKLYAHLVER